MTLNQKPAKWWQCSNKSGKFAYNVATSQLKCSDIPQNCEQLADWFSFTGNRKVCWQPAVNREFRGFLDNSNCITSKRHHVCCHILSCYAPKYLPIIPLTTLQPRSSYYPAALSSILLFSLWQCPPPGVVLQKVQFWKYHIAIFLHSRVHIT